MATLYELLDDYDYLYKLLSNGDAIDKETGEVDEVVAEQLWMCKDALNDKIQNYGIIVKQLTADAKMFEDELNNLEKRKQRAERNAEWLKEFLSTAMQQMEMTEFKNSKVNITFRKSSKVEILDPNKLDKKYMVEKTTYTPSKTMIADDLKAGIEVEGAKLVETQNIQIK